jgi:hypothetical protein
MTWSFRKQIPRARAVNAITVADAQGDNSSEAQDQITAAIDAAFVLAQHLCTDEIMVEASGHADEEHPASEGIRVNVFALSPDRDRQER